MNEKRPQQLISELIRAAFSLEMALAIICSVCFLIGFLFGMIRKYAFLEKIICLCVVGVFMLAIVLLVLTIIGFVAKWTKTSKIMVVPAIVMPIVVLFEAILQYGAAHY